MNARGLQPRKRGLVLYQKLKKKPNWQMLAWCVTNFLLHNNDQVQPLNILC